MSLTPQRPAPSLQSHQGPLTWRDLLHWLVEDDIVRAGDAAQLAQRLGAGDSAQHPLVRLANAGLRHARSMDALDLEALTRWLAQRVSLPYLRIDPIKVDVAKVTEVMSVSYAERRVRSVSHRHAAETQQRPAVRCGRPPGLAGPGLRAVG